MLLKELDFIFLLDSLHISKLKCFYGDALTELVNHYANRTLIVSCTKDCT